MLHKTCPKCGYLSHCTKSVCDVCQYVFSNKQSKKRNSRSNESSEMCELRRASDKERKARKRASENDDEAFMRRAIDRKRRKCYRANESEHEAKQRRASDRLRRANTIANESEHEAEQRRASDRLRRANTIANESEHEAEQRRASDRLRKADTIANESEHEAEQRRASDRLRKADTIANESEHEAEKRRAGNRLCQTNRIANESEYEAEQRKKQNQCSIANARAKSKSIDIVIEEFLAKVKVGPDYVCTCCHRMLYRHSVNGFNLIKYTKASPELLGELCEHLYVTSEGKQWVCKTCDGALSRGNLPIQAKSNGMQLDSEPAELACLNALEQRLISLRVPFMKMVALPSGKQRCIHGPAVNVPSKIDCVCTMLPRLPSE